MYLCLHFPEPNKPTDLAVSERTVSSLTVTWNAGAGEKSGFKVKLQGGTEQTVAGGSKGTYKFDSLTAGKEYNVVVVTESGDQRSENLTGNFHTSKCLGGFVTSSHHYFIVCSAFMLYFTYVWE